MLPGEFFGEPFCLADWHVTSRVTGQLAWWQDKECCIIRLVDKAVAHALKVLRSCCHGIVTVL